MELQSNIDDLADLWLDGGLPSEADVRAARSLAARLGSFDGLRPFSAIVQRLMAEVSRPDFELADVCKVVEMDPALAFRTLRVANSAAYRGLEPCTSVVQAVARIGAANLSGLAMALSVMTLFKDLRGVGRRVRDHSAGTAAVARELAVALGRRELSSKVFLAGLLHDIGKLLLIQSGDRAYAELVGQEQLPSSIHLREQATLGFDHGMLGAHVLRSWNIPAPIPQLIASHHHGKGGQGVGASLGPALSLLRLADVVEWLLGQRCAAHSPWVARLAGSSDGVAAGLLPETLPSLWSDLGTIREEALQIFA